MKFTAIRRGLLVAAIITALGSSTSVATASATPVVGHLAATTVAAVAPPTITQQPRSTAILPGTARFSVVATGTGLTYQWQLKAPGVLWGNISGATSSSYSVTATAGRNGNQVRAVIRNSGGQVISAPATLTVITAPRITSQPTARTAKAGTRTTFTVKAVGYNVHYRWQQLLPGTQWTYLTGKTQPSLTLTATPGRNGAKYRVVTTTLAGRTISTAARLTVVIPRPIITSQPASKWVTAGTLAAFSVMASGYGVTYRWQKLTGSTWTYISGATRSTLTIYAATSKSGSRYRAVIRNSGGQAISRVVMLGVQSTRSDPARVGVAANLNEWRVNLAGANPNAWAFVASQGFGPGPYLCNRYVTGRFNVKYLGSGPAVAWWDLDVEFVGSNGHTYTDTNKFLWANDIYSLDEMYRNASGTFYSVIEVPATAVAGGRWKITDRSDWLNPVVVWYASS